MIANSDSALGEIDIEGDGGAMFHDEFVDRIIDNFLNEHIDSILGVGAISEFANVHSCPEADVGEGVEGENAFFGVCALFLCHKLQGSKLRLLGQALLAEWGSKSAMFFYLLRFLPLR